MSRKIEQDRVYDAKRRKRAPWRALYSTKAWKARRARQLQRVPWCEPCKRAGRSRPATTADHKEPHRGDPVKFFHDELESQCATCHSSAKQREEAEGFRREINAEGWPVDSRHPFNRRSVS